MEKTHSLLAPVSASAQPACILCGTGQTRPFCPANGRGLVQCTGCGLVRVHPLPPPAALEALYDAAYFCNNRSGELGYTDYMADEANIRRTARRRLAHIGRYMTPGRLLDVGCALGFFMDEAALQGWQVEGVDISAYAAAYVRERFEYRVHRGSPEALALPAATCDLLTMFDVLEHLHDPAAALRAAARLLRPGGLLEVVTPDVGSRPARLGGPRWIGYKLSTEHLYYFSASLLHQALEAAGFEVLHARHTGKYVTAGLFLDRLRFYLPSLAALPHRLRRATRPSFYVNPLDIVAVTARRRL